MSRPAGASEEGQAAAVGASEMVGSFFGRPLLVFAGCTAAVPLELGMKSVIVAYMIINTSTTFSL